MTLVQKYLFVVSIFVKNVNKLLFNVISFYIFNYGIHIVYWRYVSCSQPNTVKDTLIMYDITENTQSDIDVPNFG